MSEGPTPLCIPPQKNTTSRAQPCPSHVPSQPCVAAGRIPGSITLGLLLCFGRLLGLVWDTQREVNIVVDLQGSLRSQCFGGKKLEESTGMFPSNTGFSSNFFSSTNAMILGVVLFGAELCFNKDCSLNLEAWIRVYHFFLYDPGPQSTFFRLWQHIPYSRWGACLHMNRNPNRHRITILCHTTKFPIPGCFHLWAMKLLNSICASKNKQKWVEPATAPVFVRWKHSMLVTSYRNCRTLR